MMSRQSPHPHVPSACNVIHSQPHPNKHQCAGSGISDMVTDTWCTFGSHALCTSSCDGCHMWPSNSSSLFTLMVYRTKAACARTQPYCGFVACWVRSEWKWNESLNFKVKWITAWSLYCRSSQVLSRNRNSNHLCTCTAVRTSVMYKSLTACCSHLCHFISIRWKNKVLSRRTTFSLIWKQPNTDVWWK